eukprot:TRINITY_DN20470_c0_g1_i1.p1 TRINITY_DN20470_c0_g1~~TRINITY_DN20470_c0_g1_i1.p1  ORF type:complete len:502 (+),score=152.64 TRINITY_DN20470_c0_g1_i1:157-1506(+)
MLRGARQPPAAPPSPTAHRHRDQGGVLPRGQRLGLAVLAGAAILIAGLNAAPFSAIAASWAPPPPRAPPDADAGEGPNPGALIAADAFHFPLWWERAGVPFDYTSPLEQRILQTWRDRHEAPPERSPFKYRLGSAKEPLRTRPLQGPLRMLAQSALGRAGKRKPPSRITRVRLPFDRKGFHFGRARPLELLALLEARWDDAAEARLPAVLDAARPLAAQLPPDAHGVLANVAPYATFHFLLVPEILRKRSQEISHGAVRLALALAARCARQLRLVFNSVGAGASVNHQHFQGMYINRALPIERLDLDPLPAAPGDTIQLFTARGWPLPTLVLQPGGLGESGAREALAGAVYELGAHLLGMNKAHNVFISEQGNRVTVVPRNIGNYPDVTRIQVAAMEVVGLWIVPNREEYGSLTEARAVQMLHAARPTAPNGSLLSWRELVPPGWLQRR